jgi:nucleoside-diphosphate-sugar epimerase
VDRVLVTGGAGYLGSVLVPDLLQAGYHVTVIDNLMYRQTSLSMCFQNKNFDFQYLDIRNIEETKRHLSKADFVIPLAAIVGAPACDKDPWAATQINKEATVSLFKNCSSSQLIIMPTTNSAYGSGNNNNFCDEKSPLKPLSRYAREKVEVENILKERGNFISFRLATVFGFSPRMRLDLLVNHLCHRAITDKYIMMYEGHFKRNYIHVRDVSRAFLLALESTEVMSNEIFNVGLSSANISKIELCEEIKKLVPDFHYSEIPFRKDPDQRNYLVSNEKIEKFGFSPLYTLQDGIKELTKGALSFQHFNFSNL